MLAELPLAPGREVTVECNPDTVTPELVDAYVAGGVNRLSFGVQSMVPHVLAALGRTHDPANVRRVRGARPGRRARPFNLDLIYGGAGESLADWRRTLDEVLALDPPHVSAYGLTVEAGTPLADDPARHPDDDDQADKYVLADDLLTAAGLDWYEISNWARPGHECRHNLLYWAQGEYLGLGCAAHSHRDGPAVLEPAHARALHRGGRGRPVGRGGGRAPRADAERRLEGLQLALRMRDGVPVGRPPARRPRRAWSRSTGDDRAVLTRRGRLLANEVALRLR